MDGLHYILTCIIVYHPLYYHQLQFHFIGEETGPEMVTKPHG